MDEMGWLIEVDEAGRMHYFSGSILFPTADPNKAVRFCRAEDAERVRSGLLAGELAASAFVHSHPERRRDVPKRWKHCRVSEHMWPEPELIAEGRSE